LNCSHFTASISLLRSRLLCIRRAWFHYSTWSHTDAAALTHNPSFKYHSGRRRKLIFRKNQFFIQCSYAFHRTGAAICIKRDLVFDQIISALFTFFPGFASFLILNVILPLFPSFTIFPFPSVLISIPDGTVRRSVSVTESSSRIVLTP